MAELGMERVVQKSKNVLSDGIRKILLDSSVPLLFIAICLAGVYYSKLPLLFILDTLLQRVTRNSFLVLSLVIPVMAGLGLNFAIVIGAMAGQIAIIAVTHLGMSGFTGFLMCVIISTPLAILFGNLTGLLLNKTRGNEMISSMIAGFFANGWYQFILLVLVGTLIPIKNPDLILSKGFGVRNTIDLSTEKGLLYSLDNLYKLPLFHVLAVVSAVVIIALLVGFFLKRSKGQTENLASLLLRLLPGAAVLAIGLYVILTKSVLATIKLPIVTSLFIAALYLFNLVILKTKLGQNFRTVGQDMHIAQISGINVDKTRKAAVIFSIVFAAWGQVIFLQNIGTLSTYGSHVQIATFSVAAILLGGASVARATSGQAILGVILFHTLFIVSPKAGNNLFGDAQIGEFFRAFVSYGVIAVALGLHAWRKAIETRKVRLESKVLD